ncbi:MULTISPECIES: hypothetical protein [unclassified Duganella]|uniref:hypothetical protein n=1 Tax=unclassified Duganella TaxID=2636909 RepID=UPI0011C13FDE|nr:MULTISPECIES: hypothetical protein [unclassified Duganella]
MLKYQAIVRGDKFLPASLDCISRTDVLVMRTPGENLNGRPSMHGVLAFNGDSVEGIAKTIKEILSSVSPRVVDYIEFNVTYSYENQCNLEFSGRELDLIRDVGGFLTVTCYQES